MSLSCKFFILAILFLSLGSALAEENNDGIQVSTITIVRPAMYNSISLLTRESVMKGHISGLLTSFGCQNITVGEKKQEGEQYTYLGTAECHEVYQIFASLSPQEGWNNDFLFSIQVFQIVDGVRIVVTTDKIIID
jgi:hypothetical protein